MDEIWLGLNGNGNKLHNIAFILQQIFEKRFNWQHNLTYKWE